MDGNALPTRVDSAADWNPDQLVASDAWNHTLTDLERDELLALREGLDGGGPGDDDEPRWRGVPIERLGADRLQLPYTVHRLHRIQQQLEEGAGAVWLHGFPSEGLTEAEARLLYWALSVNLGTPVSQSPAGERIYSVRDAGFGNDDPRSRGPNTKKRLSFHTDRADVVGFLCLQQAREGGENEIASSVGVYNEIARRRPDLLRILAEPFYYLRHTVDSGNDLPWCRQPVFSFCEGHFACCFLRVLIERAHKHPDLPPLTVEQTAALDLVEEIAGEPGRFLNFRQQPGDLLFMNNWVVLHRRRAFVDHEDVARRRHILRLWLSMPNSRPLDPLFRDNFGAVEAGAVRGGMRAAT